MAAAFLGRRAVDHAGLWLGPCGDSRPRPGADGADIAGGLYVRAAALYAAPALFALEILSRDLARRAGLPFASPDKVGLLIAIVAVFFAYPTAMAVAARGTPDVGGLVFVVFALRLAERLARLLALRPGHNALVAPMTRRVALALALTLFAMFAFRRWYAFAAAEIAIMLVIEAASIALNAAACFRWKDAVAAAALGVLTLLALASPVIVGWLPNLGAHDYATSYAAYRKPPDVSCVSSATGSGFCPRSRRLSGRGGSGCARRIGACCG